MPKPPNTSIKMFCPAKLSFQKKPEYGNAQGPTLMPVEFSGIKLSDYEKEATSLVLSNGMWIAGGMAVYSSDGVIKDKLLYAQDEQNPLDVYFSAMSIPASFKVR